MFLPLHDRNALRVIPFQRVTLGLIVLNCAVFALQVLLGAGAQEGLFASAGFTPVELWGGTSPASVGNPELPAWATLFTYSFLHGDIWHLAGNMLFLWVFGDNIEDAMGHRRFLLFYLLGGAAAALAEGFLGRAGDLPLIGASGATAACIGAYLMLYPRVRIWVLVLMRVPLPLPAYGVIAGWLLMQGAFLVIGGEDQIAWWAHLGGFAAGALMIVAFRRKGLPLFGREPAPTLSVGESALPPPPLDALERSSEDTVPLAAVAAPSHRPARQPKKANDFQAQRRRRREIKAAPRKAGWPIDPAD